MADRAAGDVSEYLYSVGAGGYGDYPGAGYALPESERLQREEERRERVENARQTPPEVEKPPGVLKRIMDWWNQ